MISIYNTLILRSVVSIPVSERHSRAGYNAPSAHLDLILGTVKRYAPVYLRVTDNEQVRDVLGGNEVASVLG